MEARCTYEHNSSLVFDHVAQCSSNGQVQGDASVIDWYMNYTPFSDTEVRTREPRDRLAPMGTLGEPGR